MKEWNSPFNPFNSMKILLWRKHLEACAKGEYLIPMMVDIDPSPMCNFFCGHCLLEDEKITTVYGGNKKIKNIKNGDKVLSFDTDRHEITSSIVKNLFERITDQYLKIELIDNKVLNVTKEHPIYMNGNWKLAGELKIGDEILVIDSRDKVKYRMKVDNPSFNTNTVEKIKKTKDKLGTYEKISKLMTGKSKNRESVEKCKQTRILTGANVRLSERMKENNPMYNKDTQDKVRKTIKLKYASGEIKVQPKSKDGILKLSNYMKVNNPMYNKESVKKRLAHVNYDEIYRKGIKTEKRVNKLEDFFNLLIPEPYRQKVYYNKDYKFIISGVFHKRKKRIPDFCVLDCNNKIIKVIELGVIDNPNIPWNKTEEDILEMYSDYNSVGIECLFISQLDIKNNVEDVKNRLLMFLSDIKNCPHYVKIKNISIIKKEVRVFNFECDNFNNYFANNILVHNCNADDVIKKDLKNLPGEHFLKLADFLINWRKDDYERIHSSCISGGGESMMNPITPELCEKLNNGGIEVGLITNGSLFNSKNISQMIRNCRWIGISMDAATVDTFSEIKGVRGDIFNKVIENIKLLVKEIEKQNVNNGLCYKFLLTPINYKEIYEAVKLAKSLGVHDFHLRPVGFEGVSKLKGQKLEYTPEMLDIINKQMDEAMKLETEEFKVYGIRHKFTPNFQPKKNFSKCWTIPLLPTFGADGIVHYCFDIRGRVGTEMCKHYPDVTEISRFWNSQKHKDMVNNFDVKSCTKCTFSQYNEVVENVFINDSMYREFI